MPATDLRCWHHWHLTGHAENTAGRLESYQCCHCGKSKTKHIPPRSEDFAETWRKPACGPYNPDRPTDGD